MANWKTYFHINVSQYVRGKDFEIVRMASLNYPKDNAVMFIIEKFMDKAYAFYSVNNCLIFWPENMKVPSELEEKHAICKCADPHVQYCKFFVENKITYYPKLEEYDIKNGAYIAKSAQIGRNAIIFPGVYIGGEVKIGDNVFIGSGAKLVGEIIIGNNVVIRENAVLGADGLSTDRGENGAAVTMPQFGGIILEDDVQIGANTVIGRAAIDYTVIHRGSKIDNCCFISHNVQVGADTFIVGESILFGSSSTGEQAYISGNAAIRNGIHIGEKAFVGMGAVVVKPVADGAIVKGNPAK